MLLVILLLLLLHKAELLALSDCVELFTKPWSSAVNDLYFWSIVRALIDLMCQNMPKISYEDAGNQSSERRGRLSLFLSPSCSLSVYVPWLCLCAD